MKINIKILISNNKTNLIIINKKNNKLLESIKFSIYSMLQKVKSFQMLKNKRAREKATFLVMI